MISIKVPPLGESIVEATISRWLKKEGDSVAQNESLVELETDKITVEVPAFKAGVLTKQNKKEGDTVQVGEEIGEIDESASAVRRAGDARRPQRRPKPRKRRRAAQPAPAPGSRAASLRPHPRQPPQRRRRPRRRPPYAASPPTRGSIRRSVAATRPRWPSDEGRHARCVARLRRRALRHRPRRPLHRAAPRAPRRLRAAHPRRRTGARRASA